MEQPCCIPTAEFDHLVLERSTIVDSQTGHRLGIMDQAIYGNSLLLVGTWSDSTIILLV